MNHKVLTVDDSRTIRLIVKKAFQPYNCDLIEAENGQEGLMLAAREKPDLIVLDITMPVMTGLEMLSRLKENEALKAIPVIMLTAESGKDNVMNIVKMGVKDYIVKPFRGEQLIERARHVLNLNLLGASEKVSEISNRPQDCFAVDHDFLILSLPARISRSLAAQIGSVAKEKFGQMTATWANKFILDLRHVADFKMNVIQLIIALIDGCDRTRIPSRLVASATQANTLKSFKEIAAIETVSTVEHAKASLSP